MPDLYQHLATGTLHTSPWVLNWYVAAEWKKL